MALGSQTLAVYGPHRTERSPANNFSPTGSQAVPISPTSGKGCFPTQAARREIPASRTVLAVKGSLRRAKTGRALDSCGPFCRRTTRDGRLRRENNHSLPCAARLRFASDPPAVPRRYRDCTREASLLLCLPGCFEAGRFTQTQSSRTALCCSRKWMSGHAEADALTQFVTDRKKQIVQHFGEPTTALQGTLPSAGEVLFSLDKPLSWMSPFSKALRIDSAMAAVKVSTLPDRAALYGTVGPSTTIAIADFAGANWVCAVTISVYDPLMVLGAE